MTKLFEAMPLWQYNLAALVVFVVLYTSLKSKNPRHQQTVLYILSGICFAFFVINDYYFITRGYKLITMLPLQLCNISVFLLPIVLVTKNQALLDFAFFAGAPGALAALLTPNSVYRENIYALITIAFFVCHFIIVAIPFLMAGWGLYKPAPSFRKALRLTATVLLMGGVMHGFNLYMIKQVGIPTNYFFTIARYSTAINPVFELFYNWIPFDFFFLLPALVVLYLYMALVFLITRTITKISDSGVSGYKFRG